jgi:hypothetical protein
MHRTHSNPIRLPGRRWRIPSWAQSTAWLLFFVALSSAVLALTAYQG